MIDKYRYAANDITSNNQHMYGYKEIELESHVHIQANRATSFRLFFPWASLLNHQVNVQMNEQNDQGNSYILLLPMCPSYVCSKEVARQRNLPQLEKALVSIWHYKSAYRLRLKSLISLIICNLGKEIQIVTFSPGLKGGRPLYGQVPHRKASPNPHCKNHSQRSPEAMSVIRVIIAACDGFSTRNN